MTDCVKKIFYLALASLIWLSFGFVKPLQAEEIAQGVEIFQTHCATCHGPAGGPDPDSPLVQSLGVVPANFADALFNSREPASDWKIVITHGGPALGFSDKMPAFGEILTEQDIDAVLVYIKTLGGEHDYPDGDLNLPLPIRVTESKRDGIVLGKRTQREQVQLH